MTANLVPVLLVIVPLLLTISAFLRVLTPKWQLSIGIPLISLGTVWAMMTHTANVTWSLGGWALPVGIQWSLNATSVALLAMTTTITGIAGYAGYRHVGSRGEHWTLWWLLWGALNVLWLSRDLFNVYVALELVTLSAAGLIVLSPKDVHGIAALRYVLVAIVASLFYLFGIGILYGLYGTLDVDLISQQATLEPAHTLAALSITLGLLIKAAAVPLHSWLPQAHTRASPHVSAMLSAVVVAVAVYWLWQLWQGPFRALISPSLFATLGCLSLLWGGINALQQTQLKRLVAYSTVSQMGYALLLLSLPPTLSTYSLAYQGTTALLVAHGLAKAALFLIAGALVASHGGDHLHRLTGSAYQHPWLWGGFALAAGSLVGFPPSGGFMGKWWLFIGLWEAERWVTAGLFTLGTLLTAAYFFRVVAIALRPVAFDVRHTPFHWAQSGLPLLLGGLAWGVGVVLIAQQGLLARLSIDITTALFGLPALLVWALVLMWQHQHPSPPRRVFTGLLWATALAHGLALLAQDWLTFYIALAWLGVLCWLLILQSATAASERAGRLYLAMMLLAEVLLFVATAAMVTHQALAFDSGTFMHLSPFAVLLLAVALAIKAGVFGVHGWLPIAHPAAPALASALLSGVMIKLGVLGALRLLTESTPAVAAGQGLFYFGLGAALYAGVRGLVANTPKTVLAWSSVGQIGVLTAGISALLLAPDHSALRTAILLLVMSHGLAKAALFIGTGQWSALATRSRRWVSWGMTVAALTLIGAPLSGGLYIKSWISYAADSVGLVGDGLILASIATAGLMLRFAWLLRHQQPTSNASTTPAAWLWWGWGLLCAGAWLIPLAWQVWLPYPGSWYLATAKAVMALMVTFVFASTLQVWPPSFSLVNTLPLPSLPWQHASRLRLTWVIERRLRHWSSLGIMLVATSVLFLVLVG